MPEARAVTSNCNVLLRPPAGTVVVCDDPSGNSSFLLSRCTVTLRGRSLRFWMLTGTGRAS